MSKEILTEEKIKKPHKLRIDLEQEGHSSEHIRDGTTALTNFQKQVGNRALQRLLAQRSSDASFELDDEIAGHINRERGGGQPLDTALQKLLSDSMGQDFSGVRVHTSRESDELNQQLSAKAFTTGQDIFFREGAYDPGSSSGQELIAHELTHVVQQSSGAVGGSGGGMTVNAPGDAFEQEADAVAKTVANPSTETGVQRQELEEEADRLQRQEMDEEDEELQ